MITINKSQAIVVNGFLSCLLLLRRVRLPVLLINYIFMYLQLTFAVEPSPPLVGIIVGPTRCDAMRCHATRRKINNFRNGFFNDTNYEFLIGTAAGHLSSSLSLCIRQPFFFGHFFFISNF